MELKRISGDKPVVEALPVPVSELGEGPVWDAQQQRIMWVDIEKGKIHVFQPEANRYNSFEIGQMVGAVALTSRQRFVGALQNGFAFIDIEKKTVEIIGDPESHLPGNRFNDGKCDPAGRFWAGSMSLTGNKNAGSLYLLEKRKVIKKMEGVSCSNGLAWSSDHQILYFIDSPTRCIKAFDYALLSGEITKGRNVIAIAEQDGYPDGMTIDEQGMLWIALWGGGKVQRWNPLTSSLLLEIRVPVVNVTSCTFGGANLTDLYITTAAKGLTESERKAQPLAGSLFVVKNCGYKGLPATLFKED